MAFWGVFGRGAARTASRGFKFWFKFSIISIFLLFIITNSAIVAIEAKDINVFFDDIGERFLSPFTKLSDYSIEVVDGDSNFFSYTGLISALFTIYLWFMVINKYLVGFFLRESNAPFIRMFFSIIIFVGIQLIYLAKTNQDFNILWQSFGDFFRALKVIISSGANMGSKFIGEVNGTS